MAHKAQLQYTNEINKPIGPNNNIFLITTYILDLYRKDLYYHYYRR